jgi:hypothetical protein
LRGPSLQHVVYITSACVEGHMAFPAKQWTITSFGNKTSGEEKDTWLRKADNVTLNYRDLKKAIFWDDTPCGSCKTRRFRGTYRLYHRGDKSHMASHPRRHHSSWVTSVKISIIREDINWILWPKFTFLVRPTTPDYVIFQTTIITKWSTNLNIKGKFLVECKIWGFHGGDYEECRLLGLLRHVALIRTDVSEELSSSIIRVTGIGELLFLVHRFLSPWWWRW